MIKEELYKENILDHNKNPHHQGVLSGYAFKEVGQNVNCGDDLVLYFKFNKKDKMEVSFEGQGCAISMAATSMLMDKIQNMTMEELEELKTTDIYKMLGIKIGISREDCALLGLKTLKKAIDNYEK